MHLLICQLFFRLFLFYFQLIIQLFDDNVNCLNCVKIIVYYIHYSDDCTILNPHILNSLYSLSLSLSSVTFAISSTLPLFFSSTTNLASLSSPFAFPLASPSASPFAFPLASPSAYPLAFPLASPIISPSS